MSDPQKPSGTVISMTDAIKRRIDRRKEREARKAKRKARSSKQ